MKYLVTRTGDMTFRVENDEDGWEYFVRYDVFGEKWKCSCRWNVTTNKECKHIRFIKKYLVYNQKEFENGR